MMNLASIKSQMSGYLRKYEAPEYGFRTHKADGIGYYLLTPTRIACNLWNASGENARYPRLMRTANKVLAVVLVILSVGTLILLAGLALRKFAGTRPVKVESPKTLADITLEECSHPQLLKQIRDLLGIVNRLFDANNLWYTLEAGSLLGALRHRNCIPWDDDGDVIVRHRDKDRILNVLRGALEEHHLVLDTSLLDINGIIKIKFNHETVRGTYGLDPRHATAEIDLTLVTPIDREGVTVLHYWGEAYRQNYAPLYHTAHEGITPDEDWPREHAQFGDHQLWVPPRERAEDHLHRAYGEECLQYGVFTHQHLRIGPITFGVPRLTLEKIKLSDGE